MNKEFLIETIAKKSKLSKAEIKKTVDLTLDSIKMIVKSKKKLQLIGFGTFIVRNTKARTGRNPQTGKAIKIPAGKKVAFKAGKEFKKML
jgi:DNA-binding protein HU-beta